MLGNMGVDVPAEVEGLMGALDSFASMDITKPFSIVTGAIGGIANLIGGIFGGGDRRKERNIQRLQDQIDALENHMMNSGRPLKRHTLQMLLNLSNNRMNYSNSKKY